MSHSSSRLTCRSSRLGQLFFSFDLFRHRVYWKGLLNYHCPIPEGVLPEGVEQGEESDMEALKDELAVLVKTYLTHQQVRP